MTEDTVEACGRPSWIRHLQVVQEFDDESYRCLSGTEKRVRDVLAGSRLPVVEAGFRTRRRDTWSSS